MLSARMGSNGHEEEIKGLTLKRPIGQTCQVTASQKNSLNFSI